MTETIIELESPQGLGPLLTCKQAATYCSLSESTIDNLRRKGDLPAVYIVKDARYRRDHLDELIHRRTKVGGKASQ